MTLYHFASADSFVRWLAAHPGYLVVSTLTPGPHGHYSVLMGKP